MCVFLFVCFCVSFLFACLKKKTWRKAFQQREQHVQNQMGKKTMHIPEATGNFSEVGWLGDSCEDIARKKAKLIHGEVYLYHEKRSLVGFKSLNSCGTTRGV